MLSQGYGLGFAGVSQNFATLIICQDFAVLWMFQVIADQDDIVFLKFAALAC